MIELQRISSVMAKVMEKLQVKFNTQTPAGGKVPTERIQHRAGSIVALDGFGDGVDNCGLVWASVVKYEALAPCSEKQITLQVGCARCVHVIDANGEPPSIVEHYEEAIAGIDDSIRLNAALCMAARELSDTGLITGWTMGASDVEGVEGGVLAWVQTCVLMY